MFTSMRNLMSSYKKGIKLLDGYQRGPQHCEVQHMCIGQSQLLIKSDNHHSSNPTTTHSKFVHIKDPIFNPSYLEGMKD